MKRTSIVSAELKRRVAVLEATLEVLLKLRYFPPDNDREFRKMLEEAFARRYVR
jgi:hypothetical protein